MSSTAFERLAPFIQDYIYRNRWEELREVQVAACDVVFNSDDNLLLCTPTASGKTEAAFLPAITEIYNKPPRSVGILYIAPLKALINDQFLRINELCEDVYIPVTRWHGDVAQTAKEKLLRDPKGIVQTTPESLEAMLMRRKQQAIGLFSDLRFVVIDEVHNFLGYDRGVQLISLLERLQRLTGNVPRRIGLSATVGDVEVAKSFLNSGTGRRCVVPDVNSEKRRAALMLSHFYAKEDDYEDEGWTPFFESIFALTHGKKSIIFSNSREEIEINMAYLKQLARQKRERDVFFVHHGNISASDREYAEQQMKTSDLPLVTGATVTLELGIDLGDLERIVQTGAPHSVASLAQRLGRSGRRGGVAELCFVFAEEKPKIGAPFYRQINWDFMKCIALIELYREGWLEPIAQDKFPFGVLYHQTMSFLYGYGECSPSFLAQTMLGIEAFRNVPQEDFATLLRALAASKQLEITHDNLIRIGERGEHETNSHEFFAVFQTEIEYSVRDKTHEVGTLHHPMPQGERFILGGVPWQVTELDRENRIIYVERVSGMSSVSWLTQYKGIYYTPVLRKVRSALLGNEEFGYLHPLAAERLRDIQAIAQASGALETEYFQISPNTFGIFPWLGTLAYNALIFALARKLPNCINAQYSTWYMIIVGNTTEEALSRALNEIRSEPLTIDDLDLPQNIETFGKYDEFVPPELIRKQFAASRIDIEEMKLWGRERGRAFLKESCKEL